MAVTVANRNRGPSTCAKCGAELAVCPEQDTSAVILDDAPGTGDSIGPGSGPWRRPRSAFLRSESWPWSPVHPAGREWAKPSEVPCPFAGTLVCRTGHAEEWHKNHLARSQPQVEQRIADYYPGPRGLQLPPLLSGSPAPKAEEFNCAVAAPAPSNDRRSSSPNGSGKSGFRRPEGRAETRYGPDQERRPGDGSAIMPSLRPDKPPGRLRSPPILGLRDGISL